MITPAILEALPLYNYLIMITIPIVLLHLGNFLRFTTLVIQVTCYVIFLPPATKLPQGNVFTLVCQSFCSRGVWPDTTGQTTLWADPPCTVHAGIRSTSGRYKSHWNAYLLFKINVVDLVKWRNETGKLKLEIECEQILQQFCRLSF